MRPLPVARRRRMRREARPVRPTSSRRCRSTNRRWPPCRASCARRGRKIAPRCTWRAPTCWPPAVPEKPRSKMPPRRARSELADRTAKTRSAGCRHGYGARTCPSVCRRVWPRAGSRPTSARAPSAAAVPMARPATRSMLFLPSCGALPQDHGWDLQVALRALGRSAREPADPRAPSLTARALAGSDWRLVKKYDGRAPKVERPRRTRSDQPVGDDRRAARAGGDGSSLRRRELRQHHRAKAGQGRHRHHAQRARAR